MHPSVQQRGGDAAVPFTMFLVGSHNLPYLADAWDFSMLNLLGGDGGGMLGDWKSKSFYNSEETD